MIWRIISMAISLWFIVLVLMYIADSIAEANGRTPQPLPYILMTVLILGLILSIAQDVKKIFKD
jgi:hypothetical protein